MEERETIKRRRTPGSLDERLFFLVFAVIAACYVLLASDSTSPLFSTNPYNIVTADSPTFIVIGRYWLTDGAVPYRDLFDQKGPILFLLNGVGWILTGSAHGICVVQSLALCLFLALSYQTCRGRFGIPASLGITLFSLVMLTLIYGLGNTVEEYNLPVMALFLMGVLRYLRKTENSPAGASGPRSYRHPPVWAYVYGLCMAFFLLNRPSDAGPVAIAVLCIGINLLLHGEGKNLLRNLLCGILGLLTLILPFTVYFAAHHALADFWYGTIGFNLIYAVRETGFWIGELSRNSAVKILFYCLPIYGAAAAGFLALLRRQGLRAAIWLLISGYALLFYVSSRGYLHYLITFVPLCAAAACELADLLPERRVTAKLSKGLCTGLFVLAVLLNLVQGRNYFSESAFAWKEIPPLSEDELVAMIPAEDRDKVLFLDCLSSLYLHSDIRPCCPYFSFQSWQAELSDGMMQRIASQFRERQAKWVLAVGDFPAPIQDALDQQYEPMAKKGDFILYLVRDAS